MMKTTAFLLLFVSLLLAAASTAFATAGPTGMYVRGRTDTTVTLTWDSASGATFYRIKLIKDSAPSSITYDTISASQTLPATVSGLEASEEYTISVAFTTDASSVGATWSSESSSFDTVDLPKVPR